MSPARHIKRRPGRPPSPDGQRSARLTIGFYPEEMQAIVKVTDNASEFIRTAAVEKAKRRHPSKKKTDRS